MALWFVVTCGWSRLVVGISPATRSRLSQKDRGHVLDTPVCSSVMLSSSLEVTQRSTSLMGSMRLYTCSIRVSCNRKACGQCLTVSASRQWSRASPPGARPPGRYGHTLNILGSKIYIFGGQVEGHFFNDLIAFDLNQLQNPSNQWEFLKDTTDNRQNEDNTPAVRTNHTVVTHNDQLYL